MFAAGGPCVTDKAVLTETVDVVAEASRPVACLSKQARACISVMIRDLIVSTFPGSQKTIFEPNVQKGAYCKSVVELSVLKTSLALCCKL